MDCTITLHNNTYQKISNIQKINVYSRLTEKTTTVEDFNTLTIKQGHAYTFIGDNTFIIEAKNIYSITFSTR